VFVNATKPSNLSERSDILGAMCRVCLKRPEIPDERYGRCESCAKGGRIAFRFRVGPGRGDAKYSIKAGELSPHALHTKWRDKLQAYKNTPSAKPHLGLHELEMVVAKDRLETIRIANDLAPDPDAVVAALRDAAERTETGW
jgi:hypothetical protein